MRAPLLAALVMLSALAGCAAPPGQDPGAPGTNASMFPPAPDRPLEEREVDYAPEARGFLARPAQGGPFPGVVMVHEWWGLNDHIRDMARTLASEGYAVLAVDLFKGQVAGTAQEAQAQVRALDQTEATANLRAAAGHLRGLGAPGVASLGWCFGGGQSLQLALSGERLAGTVIYYGNLVTDEPRLRAIEWPVLGIFGAEDRSIPVSQVQAFERALDNLSIPNQVHIYPGVGHAFANPSGNSFAPNETRDAWEETRAFLAAALKGT